MKEAEPRWLVNCIGPAMPYSTTEVFSSQKEAEAFVAVFESRDPRNSASKPAAAPSAAPGVEE